MDPDELLQLKVTPMASSRVPPAPPRTSANRPCGAMTMKMRIEGFSRRCLVCPSTDRLEVVGQAIAAQRPPQRADDLDLQHRALERPHAGPEWSFRPVPDAAGRGSSSAPEGSDACSVYVRRAIPVRGASCSVCFGSSVRSTLSSDELVRQPVSRPQGRRCDRTQHPGKLC